MGYPRGFHRDAGDSGCVTPVWSTPARSNLNGPGWASRSETTAAMPTGWSPVAGRLAARYDPCRVTRRRGGYRDQPRPSPTREWSAGRREYPRHRRVQDVAVKRQRRQRNTLAWRRGVGVGIGRKCDSRWPESSFPTGRGCAVMAVTHLTLRAPIYPGTTTRTGPPWTRGSGSEIHLPSQQHFLRHRLAQRDGAAVGLDRDGLRRHVGGIEGNVQAVIVVDPGRVEDVGQPGATPFGGRDRAVGPGSLPGIGRTFSSSARRLPAHARVATTQWAVNRVVSCAYVTASGSSTIPSTVRLHRRGAMSGNGP